MKTILNLNRSNSTWSLDPRENFSNVFDPNGTPQGIGNQVSVEFNLIYRWHCTTNDHDEAWAKSFFGKLFPGEDPSTLTLYPAMLQDFAIYLTDMWSSEAAEDSPPIQALC